MWRYFLRDAVVLQIRTVSCRFLFVANENFREFSRKIRGNLLVVALAEIPRGVGNVQVTRACQVFRTSVIRILIFSLAT
jgi:hypothetical protein